MPKTRLADIYLGCLDGSVFIDFDKTKYNQISVVRISFDGFGCCNLGNEVELLNQEAITALVKKSIEKNAKHIWTDARSDAIRSK